MFRRSSGSNRLKVTAVSWSTGWIVQYATSLRSFNSTSGATEVTEARRVVGKGVTDELGIEIRHAPDDDIRIVFMCPKFQLKLKTSITQLPASAP
jgi:hypothetical protein